MVGHAHPTRSPRLISRSALGQRPWWAVPTLRGGHGPRWGGGQRAFDDSATTLSLVAVGKFSGTGMVTLPVAAHSVPRARRVWNPTQRAATVSLPMVWPMTVVKTRP